MPNIPTPHNTAAAGDFAKTVLMPGDPLRSRFIAENYLENRRLVNDVRGVQGYTGTYKGEPVSVMASGMGMASIGIYSYELFRFYGVENILRVGSAGGISEKLKLRDIVFGQAACTDSNFGAQYGFKGSIAPIADFTLLRTAAQVADERGLSFQAGNLYCTDVFYNDDPSQNEVMHKLGVLAVEMESAALYLNAARTGGRALAICTVSDNLLTGEALSAMDRQNSFREMIELALETAIRL